MVVRTLDLRSKGWISRPDTVFALFPNTRVDRSIGYGSAYPMDSVPHVGFH